MNGAALPLGIRNSNPGNLRVGGNWQGETQGEGGFAAYPSMVLGLRAMAKNLLVYQDRYGLDTVREFVTRWSTTDREAYISYVCTVCDLRPDDRIDLHDRDTLFWVISAMIEMENGHDAATRWVSDSQIDQAITMAYLPA